MIKKIFVEELISMHAINRESVTYKGECLIINDHLGLEFSIIKEIPDHIIIKGNLDLSDTKQLQKIGDNVCIEGNLIIRNSSIMTLGTNLKVLGDLELYDCPIKSLPIDIDVKGRLEICSIKGFKLPKELSVTNHLYISNCDMSDIPEELVIGGDMHLSSCNNLKEISNIHVGRDLVIHSCNLLSSVSKLQIQRDLKIFGCVGLNVFPSDASVGRNLWIKNTNLQQLPSPFSVKGDLDLSGSQIANLPEDLHIGGSLILSGCKKIEKLPNRIVIGRDLNLTNTEIPESIHVLGKIVHEIKKVSIQNNEQLVSFLLDEQLISQDRIKRDGKKLIIDNSLDLTKYQIEDLNVQLIVNGNLSLKHVRHISGSITVNGRLRMAYAKVQQFDASVITSGDMDLHGSKIVNPPKKLVVNGDLDMTWIEDYITLPEEIDVKGNLKLDSKDLMLPRKISVGKDALINADYLDGLEELEVKGNLTFAYSLKEECITCSLFVGGNLDLSFSEVVEITGEVKVKGNLNLAHTTKLEEISDNVNVGKRLIVTNSLLNTLRIKEAKKEGCLIDNTVIEGNIRFSSHDVDVKKIGHNVIIYGNAEFSYCCIEEIGQNFTVYGTLKLEKATIKSIGDGLAIYGDTQFINSSIDKMRNSKVKGKLLLEGININLLGDSTVGEYIYSIDSDVTTMGDCLIYNYNDFISQFRKYIEVEDYNVKREVEEYFKCDAQIKRLVDHLKETQLTRKILKLETKSLLNEFVFALHETCEKIKSDPSLLVDAYDHIVFTWEEGYVKCMIKQYTENVVINVFELEDYKELIEEIHLIKNKAIQKNYELLLDGIMRKILIRDFALLQMNGTMDSINKWGKTFAEEMYYRFLEEQEDEDDDEPIDYDLSTVLHLQQDEFRFFIGSYYRW